MTRRASLRILRPATRTRRPRRASAPYGGLGCLDDAELHFNATALDVCTGPCACVLATWGRCRNGYLSLSLVLDGGSEVSEGVPLYGTPDLSRAALVLALEMCHSRALTREGRPRERALAEARRLRRAIRANRCRIRGVA